MIALPYNRNTSPTPSLIFTWGQSQKMVQFWTVRWSSLERKQFNWNQKQIRGASMAVLRPTKIWFSSVPPLWETGVHFRFLWPDKCVAYSSSRNRLAPIVCQRPRLSLKPRPWHFAYLSPNFYNGEKLKNLALIFYHIPVFSLWFWNEASNISEIRKVH